MGFIGSFFSGLFGSDAATKAADTQASAAEQGQQLQADEAQKALDFQKQQWSTQQQNLAPWLKSGTTALSNLDSLMSTPGQGLLTPWTEQFQAPTDVTEQNDPGYKFRLSQGEGALENSAAANGSLLSGNTLEAQQKFGQDYASNEYNNVYARAQEQFKQRYGIFENNQTNDFNRLSALAGGGQTAATTLGSEGQAAANNVSGIDLTTGAQQGQDLNNAAAARASGYVGSANAWNSAFGGATNNLSQLAMLSQLFNSGGGGGAAAFAG